jgi:hypothetical protein
MYSRTMITLVGWVLFAWTVYKVANTAVDKSFFYDPFAILGIKSVRLQLRHQSIPCLTLLFCRAQPKRKSKSTTSDCLSNCAFFLAISLSVRWC